MVKVIALDEVFPFMVTYEFDGKQHSRRVLINPKNRKAYTVTAGGIGGELQADIQEAILEAYDKLKC